jgi:hypothetical protein
VHEIFIEIFFLRGVYFVTGGVLKNVVLFVWIKGCGVCGSHLVKVGVWGVVGSLYRGSSLGELLDK